MYELYIYVSNAYISDRLGKVQIMHYYEVMRNTGF